MGNNFAVFILSHGRANNIDTLKTLRRANYSGKWFIVVDNQDDMLGEYKREYKNKVIVFDKEEWMNKTDTVTNEKEFASPVFARNFISCYATENGYEYYLMIDDDIKSLNIRYIKGEKLKSTTLNNFNVWIEQVINMLSKNNHILCIGTGNAGSYIGGPKGKYSNRVYIGDFSQVALFHGRCEFKGIFNEDENVCLLEANKGRVAMLDLNVSHASPKRKSNKGGLKEEYNKTNDYFIAMCSFIVHPSACRIVTKKGKIQLRITRNYQCPKVVNERYKK